MSDFRFRHVRSRAGLEREINDHARVLSKCWPGNVQHKHVDLPFESRRKIFGETLLEFLGTCEVVVLSSSHQIIWPKPNNEIDALICGVGMNQVLMAKLLRSRTE